MIDQDTITFEPIVWFSEGEVVGNWVTLSIRAYDGPVYHWFAKVETTLGYNLAQAGVAGELEEAKQLSIQSATAMLAGSEEPCSVVDETTTTVFVGWRTTAEGSVCCTACGKAYTEQTDGPWLKNCAC